MSNYFSNLGNLPTASDIANKDSFSYPSGLSPTKQGEAYLILNKEGSIRSEHIAHEVLHGIALEHTFNKSAPIAYKQGSTNNYMDYREHKGEKYTTEKWQWEQLHQSPYTK